MAETINDTLKFRGAWFFQVKERDDGKKTLTEIAPRVAGTMLLYRNLGVNFALLSVFDAMGLDIEINVNTFDIEIDRALTSRFKTDLTYKHLYIDLDDCLIFENQVNLQAVALLYQCLNRNSKIVGGMFGLEEAILFAFLRDSSHFHLKRKS